MEIVKHLHAAADGAHGGTELFFSSKKKSQKDCLEKAKQQVEEANKTISEVANDKKILLQRLGQAMEDALETKIKKEIRAFFRRPQDHWQEDQWKAWIQCPFHSQEEASVLAQYAQKHSFWMTTQLREVLQHNLNQTQLQFERLQHESRENLERLKNDASQKEEVLRDTTEKAEKLEVALEKKRKEKEKCCRREIVESIQRDIESIQEKRDDVREEVIEKENEMIEAVKNIKAEEEKYELALLFAEKKKEAFDLPFLEEGNHLPVEVDNEIASIRGSFLDIKNHWTLCQRAMEDFNVQQTIASAKRVSEALRHFSRYLGGNSDRYTDNSFDRQFGYKFSSQRLSERFPRPVAVSDQQMLAVYSEFLYSIDHARLMVQRVRFNVEARIMCDIDNGFDIGAKVGVIPGLGLAAVGMVYGVPFGPGGVLVGGILGLWSAQLGGGIVGAVVTPITHVRSHAEVAQSAATAAAVAARQNMNTPQHSESEWTKDRARDVAAFAAVVQNRPWNNPRPANNPAVPH